VAAGSNRGDNGAMSFFGALGAPNFKGGTLVELVERVDVCGLEGNAGRDVLEV
jgi:hypothetical protein